MNILWKDLCRSNPGWIYFRPTGTGDVLAEANFAKAHPGQKTRLRIDAAFEEDTVHPQGTMNAPSNFQI